MSDEEHRDAGGFADSYSPDELDDELYELWFETLTDEQQQAEIDRIDAETAELREQCERMTREAEELRRLTLNLGERWRLSAPMFGAFWETDAVFVRRMVDLSVDLIQTQGDVLRLLKDNADLIKDRVGTDLGARGNHEKVWDLLAGELRHEVWLPCVGAVTIAHALLDQYLTNTYGLFVMSSMLANWAVAAGTGTDSFDFHVYSQIHKATKERVKSFRKISWVDRIRAIGDESGVLLSLDPELVKAWEQHRRLRNEFAHCTPVRHMPGREPKAGALIVGQVYSTGDRLNVNVAHGALSVVMSVTDAIVRHFEKILMLQYVPGAPDTESRHGVTEDFCADGRDFWFPYDQTRASSGG